jgi:type IV secretory pathway VirJ component
MVSLFSVSAMHHYQAQTKGWVSWTAAWSINLQEALRHHWNNCKYGARKLVYT